MGKPNSDGQKYFIYATAIFKVDDDDIQAAFDRAQKIMDKIISETEGQFIEVISGLTFEHLVEAGYYASNNVIKREKEKKRVEGLTYKEYWNEQESNR